MADLKALRKKWYEKNPNCPFCGVEMILPEDVGFERKQISQHSFKTVLKEYPDNLCTIEHLYSRLNPLRKTENVNRERRRIICCLKCNNARAREEEKALGIEVLHERAHGSKNN